MESIGWLGFAFGFIVLSFYSVVGGWILSYLARALIFQLNGLDYGIDVRFNYG